MRNLLQIFVEDFLKVFYGEETFNRFSKYERPFINLLFMDIDLRIEDFV